MALNFFKSNAHGGRINRDTVTAPHKLCLKNTLLIFTARRYA